ncbi:MAG: Transposase [Collimonas fungivorans]|uniref:transposase n=1 Tax=Collimonas fungivorans TaxID=158899 RepID=UPI0026EAA90C|nr:transposase [Collimonas fungivorans]MDB5765813.1 Transposase [Collimonas fungivorans]
MMKQTAQYEMKLDDGQWQQLEPLLIGRPGDPGVSARNNRLFIEALLWVVLNKAPWSSLPPQFGKSSTAYMRFRRWNECDFWRQLAHSKVGDAQLQQMLDTVVDYGDRYTSRLEQRIARKAKKNSYRAAAELPDRNPAAMPADASTLHWVGLLGS